MDDVIEWTWREDRLGVLKVRNRSWCKGSVGTIRYGTAVSIETGKVVSVTDGWDTWQQATQALAEWHVSYIEEIEAALARARRAQLTFQQDGRPDPDLH